MAQRSLGPYVLEALLGAGGMGEVHRAHDTVRDRRVALKVLPEAFSHDSEYSSRFRREQHIAARLRDPHIIPIHDFGEVDGRLFIDMRLVDGRDAAGLLTAGGLTPPQAVHLVEQTAQALDAAHAEGLVHRDVKPSNLLVTPSGFVYVVDFGIARQVGTTRTSLTVTGATVGTLDYMAPERFTTQPIDARADVYSLACMLYEFLTARRPFPGHDLPSLMYAHFYTEPEAPSAVAPALPAALDEVVLRGMAKNPDDRYATAGELAAAAQDALGAVAPVRWSPVVPAEAPGGSGEVIDLRDAPPAGRAEQDDDGERGRATAGAGATTAGGLGLVVAGGAHRTTDPLPAAAAAAAAPAAAAAAVPADAITAPAPAPPTRSPAAPGPGADPLTVVPSAVGPLAPPADETVVAARGAAAARTPEVADQPTVAAAAPEPGALSGSAPGSGAAPGDHSAAGLLGGAATQRPQDRPHTPGHRLRPAHPPVRQHAPAARASHAAPAAPPAAAPAAHATAAPTAASAAAAPAEQRRRRRGGVVALVVVAVLLVGALAGGAWWVLRPDGSTPVTTAATQPAPATSSAPPAAAVVPATSVAIPAVGPLIPVGDTPGFVEVTPDGRFAYIANRDAGVVTVIDTAVDQVTATIRIDAGPPQFLSFSPDGGTAYISTYRKTGATTYDQNDVVFLDTATNKITHVVPVGQRPFASATTPDGSQLWVPSHDTGKLDIIDVASATVVAEQQVAPNPHWVAFSKDGKTVFTANHESGVVSAIDAATRQTTQEIAVGKSPHSTAVSPDGSRVAVVCYDSNDVWIIDSATRAVVATVPVDAKPQDIAYAPDGQHLYTANVDAGTVDVLDTATNTVTASIPVGGNPTSISVRPDGEQAYVTLLDQGQVRILDVGR